jgi:hypothetical protein
MKGLKAVGWINNKDEIKDQVIKTLSSPEMIAPDVQKWKEKLILHPLDKNSERIAKAIL